MKNRDNTNDRLDDKWQELVKEAMKSNVSKEQFQQFLLDKEIALRNRKNIKEIKKLNTF